MHNRLIFALENIIAGKTNNFWWNFFLSDSEQVFWPLQRCFGCILHRRTWARNLRPDITRQWVFTHSQIRQSYSRMNGLVWWQHCFSVLHSISPDSRPHTHPLKSRREKPESTGVALMSGSAASRFPFALIWLLPGGLRRAQVPRRSGKFTRILFLCLNGFSSKSKPLKSNRNRRRRSTEWCC